MYRSLRRWRGMVTCYLREAWDMGFSIILLPGIVIGTPVLGAYTINLFPEPVQRAIEGFLWLFLLLVLTSLIVYIYTLYVLMMIQSMRLVKTRYRRRA
jgi:hypothetical protein